MTKQNIALVASVVALVISGLLYFGGIKPTALFGSTSCQSTTCLTGGLRILDGVLESNGTMQIGTGGTALTQLLGGRCSLIAPTFTVAASTTVAMDCAVTGVLSTDVVFAQFATSTVGGTNFGGWQIRGSAASTTPGFITISVVNGVGTSAVIPASIASTTKYVIFR